MCAGCFHHCCNCFLLVTLSHVFLFCLFTFLSNNFCNCQDFSLARFREMLVGPESFLLQVRGGEYRKTQTASFLTSSVCCGFALLWTASRLSCSEPRFPLEVPCFWPGKHWPPRSLEMSDESCCHSVCGRPQSEVATARTTTEGAKSSFSFSTPPPERPGLWASGRLCASRSGLFPASL